MNLNPFENIQSNPTGNTCPQVNLSFCVFQSQSWYTHPLVTSKEHDDAQVPSERAIRQRAVNGRINNAWMSDVTCDQLKGEHTRLFWSARTPTPHEEWPNDDVPPNAFVHAQCVLGPLSEQETHKFGYRKVLHNGQADGENEEGM
jgi:hypothetical protein